MGKGKHRPKKYVNGEIPTIRRESEGALSCVFESEGLRSGEIARLSFDAAEGHRGII